MKAIFLDIDGVLITPKQARNPNDKSADATCVANLNQIVEQTGAKIIISSSRREIGLDELRLLLDY